MIRSRRPGSTLTALAFTISLSGSLFGARGEDDSIKPHTIAVSATGKMPARPDIAEVTVGVVTQAPTAKDALAANNEAMSKLLQTLKAKGVAEKDIQTSQVQVAPQYTQPAMRYVPATPGGGFSTEPHAPQAPLPPAPPGEFVSRIVGYRVENTVRIVTRPVDRLGTLLDGVVQAGANQIYGIAFRIENPDQLIDEARRRAMAQAKHKAKILADEGGVVLGLPLKIEEHDGGAPPSIAFFRNELAPAAAAPSMPIAPGEQEISVTVSVVYELKQPKG
jgi:uncharacterized protein